MLSAFYYNKGDFAPLQQDALVLEIMTRRGKDAALLAVCDGIGGLKEGEYASGYVSMRIRGWFDEVCLKRIDRHSGKRKIRKDCCHMLYHCNRYLIRYGKQYGIELGTTMTMALLWKRKYLLFHVGDSRAYLLGKKCRRLTKDDSATENVLCGCIGSFSWRGVFCGQGKLKRKERLLLCSDGFWRRLEEKEILKSLGGREILSQEQLGKRLSKLGQAGRERGERDNQAAVVIGYGTEL